MNTKKDIATFYLILMCIQIIPIEGIEVSLIKFGAMCCAPMILLTKVPYITKALVWGGLYFTAILISVFFYWESLRLSTTGYLLVAMLMFITFYNLIYFEKVFTVPYFTLMVKRLILAYTIVLLIQQIARIGAVRYGGFMLINLEHLIDNSRFILTVNSLSIEPSHSARIVGALFLSLLRMYEIEWGKEHVTLSTIYQDNKWVLLGFLWTMLTMGSGSAIVCLLILALYFIRPKYAIPTTVLLLLFLFVAPYIKYKPLQRITAITEAAFTLNSKTISDADLSASARVLPYIYTIQHFDLSKLETWIGNGTDSGRNNDKWGRKRMIGGMSDYGFLSYIFALVFIFSCCIRRFFSIETLFFIILLMAEIRNVYVWWAVLMLFTVTKYFYENNIKSRIDY